MSMNFYTEFLHPDLQDKINNKYNYDVSYLHRNVTFKLLSA
jgi:hypothetical protein